jgi:hypothetical protein
VSPTTGTEPGNFVVVPPGWRPELRDGLIEEFKLPKDTQLWSESMPSSGECVRYLKRVSELHVRGTHATERNV